MSRVSRIAVVAIGLGIHLLPATAAPTTTESGAATEEAQSVPSGSLRDAAGPSAGDQMLDRLIQLQPRTAGIEIKEPRPQPAAPLGKNGLPTVMPASMKAQPAPQQAGGLFGAGALPKPVGNAEPTAVEPPWKQRELANSQASPTSRTGGDAPAPRLFLIPRELILFIRENREWVIGGSLSALALFWAGSTAFARRRSRAHG